MIADETCPECHSRPELVYVSSTYLRKRCSACSHRWNEEHTQSGIFYVSDGWIHQDERRRS